MPGHPIPDDRPFVLRFKVHQHTKIEMVYSVMERAGFGVLAKETPVKLYNNKHDDKRTCLVFFTGVRTTCSNENLIRNRALVRHLSEQEQNYADIPYTYNQRLFLYRARIDRRLTGLDKFPEILLGTDATS